MQFVGYNQLYGWKTAYASPENQPVYLHAHKLMRKHWQDMPAVSDIGGSKWDQVTEHVNDNYFFIDMDKYNLEAVLRKGAELVKQDFTEMGLPVRQTLEVSWIVENHLLLSLAAFRLNPQSSSTWKRLHRKGVKGKRLLRLALFTAIDIIATNPDAWTDWKERLLYDWVAAMKSKQATH